MRVLQGFAFFFGCLMSKLVLDTFHILSCTTYTAASRASVCSVHALLIRSSTPTAGSLGCLRSLTAKTCNGHPPALNLCLEAGRLVQGMHTFFRAFDRCRMDLHTEGKHIPCCLHSKLGGQGSQPLAGADPIKMSNEP